MQPAGETASESWQKNPTLWTKTAQIHLFQISRPAFLRRQSADVLQAKHVESNSGECPVLVHHVGHVGGQVSAGSREHFAHVCRPRRRLLVLTGGKEDLWLKMSNLHVRRARHSKQICVKYLGVLLGRMYFLKLYKTSALIFKTEFITEVGSFSPPIKPSNRKLSHISTKICCFELNSTQF